MNKIYENQLNLNRRKIVESGPWKRKHMSDVNIPSGEKLDFPKTVTPKPKKQEVEEPSTDDYTKTDLGWDLASLADPTGAVDLANAVRYAGKGDWVGAGISALGAIPVIGNLATVGKVGKAATTLTKTKPLQVTARRIIPKSASITEIKPLKVASPVKTLTPKASSSLKTFRATANAATVGAIAGELTRQATKSATDEIKDVLDKDKKEKIVHDPIPIPQLDIYKLSMFNPGEASGYSKSELPRRHGEGNLPPGYHPFFTGPVNVELNRRRSSYAQSHGLPESVETNNLIKNKIKNSVNKYLKSKEGYELNKHLENIRNSIDFQ